jgi:hypothetical protein
MDFMVKTGQRFNRAHKIAHWDEVQRIFYTVTLTGFIHKWAIVLLTVFIPAAMTVFEFLAALNRSSKTGYMGCAVAYSLLAPQIAIATRRKCSIRTLERGIAALKNLGFIKLSWYSLPDQQVINGPHRHKINGSKRVETADGWRKNQIRIIVLTPMAIALWDRSTRFKGSDIIAHFAHLLTPAKLADSYNNDQVGKPTMIHRAKDGCSTRPQAASEHQNDSSSRTDRVSSKTHSSPLDPSDASEVDRNQTQNKRPECHELTKVQNRCHMESTPGSSGLVPKPQAGAPSHSIRTKRTGPAPKRAGTPPPPRGCTLTPPPIPRNAPIKTQWPVARAYLLAELHRSLSRFSPYEADDLYRRAEMELSPDRKRDWPTIVDWDYWVARFGGLPPDRRRHHMIRDILPLLRSAMVPTPKSETRAGIVRKPKIVEKTGKLNPFLDRLLSKFGK